MHLGWENKQCSDERTGLPFNDKRLKTRQNVNLMITLEWEQYT